MAEPIYEPENAGLYEPQPESEAENGIGVAEAEPEVSLFDDTSVLVEALVPAALLLVIFLTGPIVLCIVRERKKCRWKRTNKITNSRVAWDTEYAHGIHGYNGGYQNELELDEISQGERNSPFLNSNDKDIIRGFRKFINGPMELMLIALPCLVSLAFCPATLYTYTPLVDTFYLSMNPGMLIFPNVNEAILCFLMPAGVVYAVFFGFAIEIAIAKQGSLSKKVAKEIQMLDQVTSLTSKLLRATLEQKMAIYRCVKDEALCLLLDIQNRPQIDPYRGSSLKAISTLRELTSADDACPMDMIASEKIIKHITCVKDSVGKRMVFHTRIHMIKWGFLELLGFITFFGILLTQTTSTRLDLIFCMITVFSISLLCYIVADLDSPFSGFFRINVETIIDVITRAEIMFRFCREGRDKFHGYEQICQTKIPS